MLNGSKVAAVIACRDEAEFIGRVIVSLPEIVDFLIVVDDASTDRTADAAKRAGNGKIDVVRLDENRGVGGAIVTGYRRALERGADLVIVTNGDAQMNGAEALDLLQPLVDGEADLVKGNRLLCPGTRGNIPSMRRAGIEVLSVLTRIATGLEHIGDAQSGYHAVTASALRRLPLDELWPCYGFPNDLLIHAARAGLRVRERPIRAIYGDEVSGLRPQHMVNIGRLLARGIWQRWTAP